MKKTTIAKIAGGMLMTAATLATLAAAPGCGKLGVFAPKQACACDVIWNDPTCPNGELGVDNAVFLVPCPDGLTPRGDAGISLIKTKDVDFDEMADNAVKQVKAWTGMVLTKVTGTTNGQYRGEVASGGRQQFAQVLGCAVVSLQDGQAPDSVKSWWKSGNTGSKLRTPPPTPDNVDGGTGTDGPECDTPSVDENSQTVTFPATCSGQVSDVSTPADVTTCGTPPACPSSDTDSACVACAKASCCPDAAACQADSTCVSAGACILASGGLASWEQEAFSTAYSLGLCVKASCSMCSAPAQPQCIQVGGACATGSSAVCCEGHYCIPSDVGSTCM